MSTETKKMEDRYFCDVYIQLIRKEDVAMVFHEVAKLEGLVVGYPVYKKNFDIFIRLADSDIGRLNAKVVGIKKIHGVNEIGTMPFDASKLSEHELRD